MVSQTSTAVVVGLVFLAVSVSATPFPSPLPIPVYSDPVHSFSLRSDVTFLEGRAAWNANLSAPAPRAALPRNAVNVVELLGTFPQRTDRMRDCAKNCKTAAEFEQRCSSSLPNFQNVLEDIDTGLKPMAARAGLANYDNSDELETLLKHIIDLTKSSLHDIWWLTTEIPLVGPMLGGIVYEIKCIVDELLDITENITDGILNAFKPDLVILRKACGCDDAVLGVCLGDLGLGDLGVGGLGLGNRIVNL
ncbi:hypothetical protein VNI00_001576 [Paramarasmius palmivorus]|uniref:Uncharacterized protein n=1 Tax=Paramarasmius palmivorus TaxID=297713 RepID=A0AAW0E2I6_9AGAR